MSKGLSVSLTAPVCVLVIVAGMAELLFAASKLQSIWLPHVLINVIGGILSVVCGFGHLVALKVEHDRCERRCLCSFLVTASLLQLTGLLLLVADKTGSVGLAVHKLGIKSKLDKHDTMKTYGAAQNDADVRILLILNILCTLLIWLQCGSACTRPSTTYTPSNLHNNMDKTETSWVYNKTSEDFVPILDSSQASSPGRNSSVTRNDPGDTSLNVTMTDYKLLPSLDNPDGMNFVPLKDLKSQTLEQYCSQYSLARVAKQPMQSFRAKLPSDSEHKRSVTFMNCSASQRPGFRLPPSVSKTRKFSVLHESVLTSDEECSRFERYTRISTKLSPMSPAVTPSSDAIEYQHHQESRSSGSSQSSLDDDTWDTLSVSAVHDSRGSVAVGRGLEPVIAEEKDASFRVSRKNSRLPTHLKLNFGS